MAFKRSGVRLPLAPPTFAATIILALAASDPTYAAQLPDLPAGHEVSPGVTLHEVTLDRSGVPMRLWVYLPTKTPVMRKLPTALIAPAGSRLYHGIRLGVGDQPEHVPYPRSGFAVIAYDIDGPRPDQPTEAQLRAAIVAFRNARAGLDNAKAAIDYALAKVPQVDPRRIYAVGHSSAGTLALQVAQQDDRVAACVAFAPVVSVGDQITASFAAVLDQELPGTVALLRQLSPDANVARLKVPTLLFYAQDDNATLTTKLAAFTDALARTNPNVKVITVPSGGHYAAMVEQGIPAAIAWLAAMRPK